MSRFNLTLIGIFAFSMAGSITLAQTHFKSVSNTGNNATIAAPFTANPNIMGAPLATGDGIGVFTPDGLCVGETAWEVNKNAAVVVWGDNDQTPEVDGMRAGESMQFCVWRKSTNTGYGDVSVTFSLGDGRYAANGIYILASLAANAVAAPLAPNLESPADKTTGIKNTPKLSWYTSCGASTYTVQIADNPTFSPLVINQNGIDSTFYVFSGATSNTTYYWRVRAQNNVATSGWSSERSFTTGIITGVENLPPERPQGYVLRQNYPNPFSPLGRVTPTGVAFGSPGTEIRFHLPEASQVVLKIFNLFGEEIVTLVDDRRGSGYHAVRWDGKDERGNPVASGVYLYQLRAGRFSQVRKMSVLW
jgi:hypothetical protein